MRASQTVCLLTLSALYISPDRSPADDFPTKTPSFAVTSGQYPVTAYTSGDNGPSGSIARIAEDQFGRIYAAGRTGLWRFDGIQWNQLSSGHCLTLCFDGTSQIYAIVDGICGRWRIREETIGTFEPLTTAIRKACAHLADGDELDLNALTNTPSLINGHVYFVGQDHLLRVHHQNGKDIAKVWSAKDLPHGLLFQGVQQWQNRTIAWFLPEMSKTKQNRIAELLPNGTLKLTEPLVTQEGELLTGLLMGINSLQTSSGEEELVLIHREKFAFLSDLNIPTVRVTSPSYGERFLHLASTSTRDGIAIKTDNRGVLFLNSAGKIDVHIPASVIPRTSHQIFTDSLGRLWLPSFHTVYRIDPNNQLMQWQNDLMPDPRQVLHFDSHVIVCHSRGISVAKANPDTGLPAEPFRLLEPTKDTRQAPSHRTYSARVIGDTLFLNQVQGLYALKSLEDYRTDPKACLSKDYHVDVVSTSDDDVVVAIRYGGPSYTMIRRNGQWEKQREFDTFHRPTIGALRHQKNLWMVAARYPRGRRLIQRIDINDGTVETFECPIESPQVFEYDGRIFYALAEARSKTREHMFFEYDPKEHVFRPTSLFADIEARLSLDERQSEFRSLTQNEDGSIDVTFSDLCVLRATPKADGGWTVKSVHESIPTTTLRTSYTDAYGNVWLAANRSVYCQVATKGKPVTTASPQLVLNSLNLGDGDLHLQRSADGTHKITTDASRKSLAATFSMPASARAGMDLFRYRFTGQDDEWSEWSHRAEVRFPALSDGSYTLELQGLSNYERATPIRQIVLQITPPWFRTWWLKTGLALFAGTALVLILRKTRTRQQQKTILLQQEIDRLKLSQRRAFIVQDDERNRNTDSSIHKVSGRITHEVGNILTPVAIYGEELAAGRVPKNELRRYGTAICQAVLNAAESTRRAHPMHRDASTEVRLASIDKIVEEVAETVRNFTARGDASIRIQTHCDAVQAYVCADDIKEVLLNLSLNAVEAIAGTGTVTLACELRQNDLVLQVQDNGSGMTDDVKADCLKSFFTTKGDSRKGLGLSVSQMIVSSYGGTLEIDSEPGKGTCFRICLPEITREIEDTTAISELSVDSTSYRVLVVDSVFRTRDAIRHQLELLQHHVVDVESPSDALTELSQQSFDLITTDGTFGEITGDEFHSQLRAAGYSGPVVFIVGSPQPELLHVCDDLLLKPVTTEKLGRCIRKVMFGNQESGSGSSSREEVR